METSEKILQIVRTKGPVLPVDIAKEINTNILMASAFLSELVSNKKIKLSYVKVGGSPLYYVGGQEYKLQDNYDNLHEKEKKTYDLLKRKRILRDNIQEPIIRATLRQIKDFAKPLEVNIKDKKEIFWKWYLLSNKEAESLIKEKIHKKPKDIKKTEQIKTRPIFVDKTTTDDFLSKIKTYFKGKGIEIMDYNIIRKNSDMEFTIKIPTAVGTQTYYCRAKNKKKCNDGDLSSAYVKGEFKKHPVLFLMVGDLTKKTKNMLTKEFKNINIQKI